MVKVGNVAVVLYHRYFLLRPVRRSVAFETGANVPISKRADLPNSDLNLAGPISKPELPNTLHRSENLSLSLDSTGHTVSQKQFGDRINVIAVEHYER